MGLENLQQGAFICRPPFAINIKFLMVIIFFAQKRRELYRTVTPSVKEAGRIAQQWLYEYFEQCVAGAISANEHFAYEGHFPGDEHWNVPLQFKKSGYSIHLYFLGLSTLSVSKLRVLDRAKMGGHNVPIFEIERNYYGNLYQLNRHFHIIDELTILDTSENQPRMLALFKKGIVAESIPVQNLPPWFRSGIPNLFELISEYYKK
jgi:predicted ABC-type ATPase